MGNFRVKKSLFPVLVLTKKNIRPVIFLIKKSICPIISLIRFFDQIRSDFYKYAPMFILTNIDIGAKM